MEQFNPFSLNGKTILVTGASSGIGKAIAIACARMGAYVILTGRSKYRLNETSDVINDGTKNLVIPADLLNKQDIDFLVSQLPQLDGIVHCAGVGNRVLCKSLDKQAIENIIKPNLESPILLQAAILKQKKISKGASIVFIASAAAFMPALGNAIYSASKGGIISYAKCLAKELAPRNIRVNCICPAMIWTAFILQEGISKEELEEAQAKYPLKRYGQPYDVAYLSIYLLSDASSWMTGSAIELTGGTNEL